MHSGADWIQEWGNVEFAAYSHVFAKFRQKPMEFYVDSSTSSLSAFKSIGQMPYFH